MVSRKGKAPYASKKILSKITTIEVAIASFTVILPIAGVRLPTQVACLFKCVEG
eukprot:XP_001707067.1 Hypothetical protein GL50803_104925 [Giardia lamblia ATCC 50803]